MYYFVMPSVIGQYILQDDGEANTWEDWFDWGKSQDSITIDRGLDQTISGLRGLYLGEWKSFGQQRVPHGRCFFHSGDR